LTLIRRGKLSSRAELYTLPGRDRQQMCFLKMLRAALRSFDLSPRKKYDTNCCQHRQCRIHIPVDEWSRFIAAKRGKQCQTSAAQDDEQPKRITAGNGFQ
jgi:hypothetical protein